MMPPSTSSFLLRTSCPLVAQKTTEQANIVADSAVSGANEVAQAAVEGVENAAVASGFVSMVSGLVVSHDPPNWSAMIRPGGGCWILTHSFVWFLCLR